MERQKGRGGVPLPLQEGGLEGVLKDWSAPPLLSSLLPSDSGRAGVCAHVPHDALDCGPFTARCIVNDRAIRAPAEEAVVVAAARRKAASTATPPGVRDLSRGGDTAGPGWRRERCAEAAGAGAP